MKFNEDALAFLNGQLPQIAESRLREVFICIYAESDEKSDIDALPEFGPSLEKTIWTAQLKAIREVAQGLLTDNCDATKLMKLLPREALGHVKHQNPKNNAETAEVLQTYANLSEIWHVNNPKTGGKDIGAYQIAQVVLAVFNELEVEANVNTLADGVSPASPYGCIVKHAIDYHGGAYKSSSNWRRAAKSAVTESKN